MFPFWANDNPIPFEIWDAAQTTGITTDSSTLALQAGGVAHFDFTSTGFVWNEAGAAISGRFESDNDASIFYIDGTNDTAAIGSTNTQFTANGAAFNPKFQVFDGGGVNTNTSFLIRAASDIATQGAFVSWFRSRGTDGSPSAVLVGDRIGVFRGDGYDGSQYITAGSINLLAYQGVSTGIVGGEWQFNTNDGLGGGNTAKMVILGGGEVGIGTTAPSFNLDVNGSVRLNRSKSDNDFYLWGTVAVAMWFDAGNNRLRYGFAATGDVLELWTTKTEFNRVNNDVNFQVRTSGNNNTLWIDGGTDKVGIKTNAPDYDLDVHGDIGNTGRMIRGKSVYTGTDTISEKYAHTCDSASAFTLTVTDGTHDGEEIVITNRGAGTVTLSGKISTVTADTTLYSSETFVLRWDVADDQWQ